MQLQSSVTPFSGRPVRAFTERSVRPLKQQCRRQSLQLSSRSLSQQRRSKTSMTPRAEAVDTDNKFRLNHSVSKNNFEVKGDLNTVFNYAADFSHISSWDSGMQLSLNFFSSVLLRTFRVTAPPQQSWPRCTADQVVK